MSVFTDPDFDGHEQVVHCHERASGLHAIIAIHSTRLGPALGGIRMYPYADEAGALNDALRLARGMSYKSALAGLPLGGGKSVILGDPRRDKTPALLRAMGEAIERLGGRYVGAEDSGTAVADLQLMAQTTAHVTGLQDKPGLDGGVRSGDPSPATALGVFTGIRAAVRHRFGREDLAGLRVAIQGVGSVGHRLAQLLHAAGATLFVSDVWAPNLERALREFGAEPVAPAHIHAAPVDVYAPCALGAVLDDVTIPQLRAAIVAGAANNQLAQARHGEALRARGVLYAPDYAINAGGIIDVCAERLGEDAAGVRARVERIGATLTAIFEQAESEGLPTQLVADRLAERRLYG